MKRVIIESPYRGIGETEVEQLRSNLRHITYAKECVRDSVLRGEAPIASHLLFTQPGILEDKVIEERELGIRAGLAWQAVADYTAFYTDHGWSSGMYGALRKLCEPGNLEGGVPHIRSLSGYITMPNIQQLEEAFRDVRGFSVEVFWKQVMEWTEPCL